MKKKKSPAALASKKDNNFFLALGLALLIAVSGFAVWHFQNNSDVSSFIKLPAQNPNTSVSQKIINSVIFKCEDNKTIQASFDGEQVGLKLSDGRNMTLPQAISASGARYANPDESFVFWNTGNTAFVQEGQATTFVNCVVMASPLPSGQTVTFSGELVCLPHKDTTGPQTMECAYGLKATDGKYYSLVDSDPNFSNLMGVSTGKQVTVTGILTAKKGFKYQDIGTITITSLK